METLVEMFRIIYITVQNFLKKKTVQKKVASNVERARRSSLLFWLQFTPSESCTSSSFLSNHDAQDIFVILAWS